MSEQERIPIHSEADLKKQARTILRRVERSERGGLLYLLNPVFALQDAGFDLSIEMRRHLKRALRYGSDTKQRLRELETEIAREAGHQIHAASNSQVAELLFDQLKLPPPPTDLADQGEDLPDEAETYESELELVADESDDHGPTDFSQLDSAALQSRCVQKGIPSAGSREKLIAQLEANANKAHARPPISLAVLERMRDAHPVIPRLIEHRKLLRDGWQFVNRQTYDRVKAGATVTLLRGMKFRRRKDAGTEGGEGDL